MVRMCDFVRTKGSRAGGASPRIFKPGWRRRTLCPPCTGFVPDPSTGARLLTPPAGDLAGSPPCSSGSGGVFHPSGGSSMTANENGAVVRRFIDEVFNGGNFSVTEEILASDYVHHDPATGESGSGVEGLEKMVNF